jgi:hypothetical protein
MLTFLRRHGSARKARLLACACCRRIWDLYEDDADARATVEVVERYADGLAEQADFDALRLEALAGEPAPRRKRVPRHISFARVPATAAVASAEDTSYQMAEGCLVTDRSEAWLAAAEAVKHTVAAVGMVAMGRSANGRARVRAMRAERRQVCELLAELVGNPFRTVTFDSACRTPTILSLAQAAYDDRLLPGGHLDPARLGVLCDALLDAGCPEEHELLTHLRSPGLHVRGCFAIDLITGKE